MGFNFALFAAGREVVEEGATISGRRMRDSPSNRASGEQRNDTKAAAAVPMVT